MDEKLGYKVRKSAGGKGAPESSDGQNSHEEQAGKSAKTLKPLTLLIPYLSRNRGMVAGMLVALVAAAFAMLLVPIGVRQMIDMGFSKDNIGTIDRYFLMLLGIGLTLAVASAARFYFVHWLSERLVTDLRSDVFAHLTKLSPAFYDKTHSGEVMSRLTADTTQVKAAISLSATQALRNLIMGAGSVLMMFFTSPYLSLLILVAIPLIVLPLIAYGRAVRSLSRQAQDRIAEASAYAAENISAVRVLQAFTFERPVIKKYAEENEASFEAAKSRIVARAGLTVMAISLVFASIVGILWFGAHKVMLGEISGGTLGQFVLYAAFAAGAFGGLAEVWGDLQQASGAAERLAELLSIKSAIRSPQNPVVLPKRVAGELKLEDVTFHYPSRPKENVLDGFNLHVRAGENIAIVGHSGAGKSTLFHLLLRFYDLQAGRILIDGTNIADAKPEDIRKQIALVPQETALFDTSVLENIRYGSPEANVDEVRAAAEAANATEFIDELPDGFETVLGEHGVMLSGGQRQRIAIARAILRDAPILLLDEATSALDAQSERLVQEALERLMENRTTLVIAHRLATVKKADRICVLDKGELVEEGTHGELSAQKGIYAGLAALQFGQQSQDLAMAGE